MIRILDYPFHVDFPFPFCVCVCSASHPAERSIKPSILPVENGPGEFSATVLTPFENERHGCSLLKFLACGDRCFGKYTEIKENNPDRDNLLLSAHPPERQTVMTKVGNKARFLWSISADYIMFKSLLPMDLTRIHMENSPVMLAGTRDKHDFVILNQFLSFLTQNSGVTRI